MVSGRDPVMIRDDDDVCADSMGRESGDSVDIELDGLAVFGVYYGHEHEPTSKGTSFTYRPFLWHSRGRESRAKCANLIS